MHATGSAFKQPKFGLLYMLSSHFFAASQSQMNEQNCTLAQHGVENPKQSVLYAVRLITALTALLTWSGLLGLYKPGYCTSELPDANAAAAGAALA